LRHQRKNPLKKPVDAADVVRSSGRERGNSRCAEPKRRRAMRECRYCGQLFAGTPGVTRDDCGCCPLWTDADLDDYSASRFPVRRTNGARTMTTATVKAPDIRPGDVIVLANERRLVEQIFPMFPSGVRVRARSNLDGCAMTDKRYPAWREFTVERSKSS
jgi:hypothetical protein